MQAVKAYLNVGGVVSVVHGHQLVRKDLRSLNFVSAEIYSGLPADCVLRFSFSFGLFGLHGGLCVRSERKPL